jgi:hypothetical protein
LRQIAYNTLPPAIPRRGGQHRKGDGQQSEGLGEGKIIEKRIVLGYVDIDLQHLSTWEIRPNLTIQEFDER